MSREVINEPIPNHRARQWGRNEGELPELRQDQYDVFEEIIKHADRVSSITFSPIEKHELLQVFEFSDAIIARSSCLFPFTACYSYPDMSFIDHVNVICAVTDSKRYLFRTLIREGQ